MMQNPPIAPIRNIHSVVPAVRSRFRVDRRMISGFGSVLLIAALLAQVLFISPIPTAKAKALITAPPVSAAPEPFVVSRFKFRVCPRVLQTLLRWPQI
jgi:uncharacterized SAM-binding protein YcdF (DUF218 family)